MRAVGWGNLPWPFCWIFQSTSVAQDVCYAYSCHPETPYCQFQTHHEPQCRWFAPNTMINKADITNLPLDTVSELGAALITFCQTHRELVMWKSDVSQAYHWMPMHKHWQMRQIHSGRHVNCCNKFGSKGGYGIWSAFMSLVIWEHVINWERGSPNWFGEPLLWTTPHCGLNCLKQSMPPSGTRSECNGYYIIRYIIFNYVITHACRFIHIYLRTLYCLFICICSTYSMELLRFGWSLQSSSTLRSFHPTQYYLDLAG